MSNSDDSKPIENKYSLAVKVQENGKLAIKAKDAVEIWKDFQGDFWATRISTIGLVGNRQALNMKFSLYQSFLGQEERTQAKFVRLAKISGYRNETIEELWQDFINIYQPEFIAWLKEKMTAKPKKSSDEDILEF